MDENNEMATATTALEEWHSKNLLQRAYIAHQCALSDDFDEQLLESKEFAFLYRISQDFAKNPAMFLAGLLAFFVVIVFTIKDLFALVFS